MGSYVTIPCAISYDELLGRIAVWMLRDEERGLGSAVDITEVTKSAAATEFLPY